LNDHIHIICLDSPAPPDYGGAIDMYYKIQALAEIGKKITLHYFEYNRSRNIEAIIPYCEKIYSYKRNRHSGYKLNQPHIVASRINNELIERLNKDDHPILAEGIHCTGIIPFLNNKNRKIIVRVHNNEAIYYLHLADTETNLMKKSYFLRESKLLKHYQLSLPHYVQYACLSHKDKAVFKTEYNLPKVEFLPCFIPWQEVTSYTGIGRYCLYHGNMVVSENSKAAEWLIQNVFSSLTVPFIIAGKGISSRIKSLTKKHSHIQLIDSPNNEEMDELIRNAHINILPSMNKTGVKLKLLHALIEGRFCITNNAGVNGSGLEEFVEVAETAELITEKIRNLYDMPFTQLHQQERKTIVSDLYNNKKNAQLLNASL
jgi:glycosyltransferase involved in cell wall biosynthesis